MSPPEPATPDPREEKRRRLMGRAMVVGLLLLLLAYVLATFVR
ncbi:hypothetical protein [Phenylobacterium soli]|nr:hypothetical protein [Phenylobacterium soli]